MVANENVRQHAAADGDQTDASPGPPEAPRRRVDEGPRSLPELMVWVNSLPLPHQLKVEMQERISGLFNRQRQLLEESKDAGMLAMAEGFAERLKRTQRNVEERDEVIKKITKYAEDKIEELESRVKLDSKTKLFNFELFQRRMVDFLEMDTRSHWCVIGLADIRHFKAINDTLGHTVGDAVITTIAEILKSQARSEDIISRGEQDPSDPKRFDLHARFGGDEFCFLLANFNNPSEAGRVLERFRQAVKSHDWPGVHPNLPEVEISVGAVCLKMQPVGVRRLAASSVQKEIITEADRLMYLAKEGGSVSVRYEQYEITARGLEMLSN